MDSLILFLSNQISGLNSNLFIYSEIRRILLEHEESIKLISFDLNSFKYVFTFLILIQLITFLIFLINVVWFKFRFLIKRICYKFWYEICKELFNGISRNINRISNFIRTFFNT